jgi:peptidoglycan/LPS O-acetylase OafA/YrhL
LTVAINRRRGARPVAQLAVESAPSLLRIPALTGLRFFAAFFILFAHAVDWIAQFENNNIRQKFSIVAMYGMPLFFVLSGFVIHYNYSKIFLSHKPLRATCEFAAARAARLLPLYFAFLFMAIFADQLIAKSQGNKFLLIEILTYYSTLTQSWWYIVYNGQEIINWVFPLSWSISTEMFFYAAFVPVVAIILRIKTVRQSIVISVVYAAVVMALLIFVNRHMTRVLVTAEPWVPNYIGLDNFNESFYRWAFYFAPYTRMLEFFMGCLAAHAFILCANRSVSRVERRIADVVLIAALLTLSLFGLCMLNVVWLGALNVVVSRLAENFLCAPAIAVVLFYVGRYDSAFTRFMSSPSLVALGERSYSIYLVHTWTLRLFVFPPAPDLNWLTGADAVFRIICAILLTLLLSQATYQLIEVPSRSWLRRRFGKLIAACFRADTHFDSPSGLAVARLPNRNDPVALFRNRMAFSAATAMLLAVIVVGGHVLRMDNVIRRLYGSWPDRPLTQSVSVSSVFSNNKTAVASPRSTCVSKCATTAKWRAGCA